MSYYPLTQQLENRIKAVNDVHALLLTYGTRISKVFSDYFQLKVINQNGTFVKAVQHDLDPILNQLRDDYLLLIQSISKEENFFL